MQDSGGQPLLPLPGSLPARPPPVERPPPVDGIHFRGSEGSNCHTSSLIATLKSTGLGGWSSQWTRGAARQPGGRTISQMVGTSNQFKALNC